ncbi:MAG: DUF2608 domain-containing protein [Candidatus Endonucleobacter sp. (ex Gigantidas childressi)]|nr:DUF2608 domain-containing protein [Candidatus Endonucleobacter sp. (ex Gigantidas childressi)]
MNHDLPILCQRIKLLLLFLMMGLSAYIEEVGASPTSVIIEIHNISSLKSHISPNTLILFDIDNTLIEPVQTLASDQWFCWRIEHYESLGNKHPEALDMALMEWSAAVNMTKVKEVEPSAHELIEYLQSNNYIVMGLTTRSPSLSTATIKQLKSVQIQLLQTAPSKEEVIFLNPREVIYKNGILFTAGTNKGNALLNLFTLINQKLPEKVLFINDKKSHLKQVQQACEDNNISFIGLRYDYLDRKVQEFSQDIAEYQLQHFSKLLSDDETRKAIDELAAKPL